MATRSRRMWSGPALVVVGGAVLAAVGGCSSSSASDCEETFESLSLSVDGVTAADFECERSFGNATQRGTVTVAGTTEGEVVGVMEDVLRVYAASPDLDDASVPTLYFVSEDGGVDAGPTSLGFNGSPALSEIREHYGIQP